MRNKCVIIIFSVIFTLAHSCLTAQPVKVDLPDKIDTINLNVTKSIAGLLEQQKVNKAIAYFKFRSEKDRKAITSQLEKIAKDIQPIKQKTKVLFQTSFRNYKDSFNIDQVIYFNEEGRYYLFELFFLKGDASSKVVDLFLKDPAVLEKNRKTTSELKKKNPGIPQPPQSLPPGVYIKEIN
jgi:hypothetical protein